MMKPPDPTPPDNEIEQLAQIPGSATNTEYLHALIEIVLPKIEKLIPEKPDDTNNFISSLQLLDYDMKWLRGRLGDNLNAQHSKDFDDNIQRSVDLRLRSLLSKSYQLKENYKDQLNKDLISDLNNIHSITKKMVWLGADQPKRGI